jgi:ABC-type cobalamin/Fe3+-siderophores transport system ATPase subunit
MLENIAIKFGAKSGSPPLTLDLVPSITVFVGPNNSGKSALLGELFRHFSSAEDLAHTKILASAKFSSLNPPDIDQLIESIKRPSELDEHVSSGNIPVSVNGSMIQISNPSFINALSNPANDINSFCHYYLKYFILNMTGAVRLGLLQNSAMGALNKPTTTLDRLYTDDARRTKWQRVIVDALGLYAGIYNAQGGVLSTHFGMTPPRGERTHNADAIEWVRGALSVNHVSDGIRAFAGILAELHAGSHKIVLMDEPEAFLHPSLARRLGKEVALLASQESRQVFVSTHSADFLMGAVLSGARVNVVRLTWDGRQGTARLLDHSRLQELITDPMLRSVGVLSGLFHKNVIVTEADVDRAFYSEINERLSAASDQRAIEHPLFLNADNHQTIPRIVGPLRQLGIPAAAVFDLDAISEGGATWRQKLDACSYPSLQKPSSDDIRRKVHDALVAKAPSNDQKKFFKTNGGLSLLSGEELEAAQNFLTELENYGLFFVRMGEVEAWLGALNVPKGKNTWRTGIFQAMGSDPNSGSYVQPTSGDVWDFIGRIKNWLADPSRKGIP